MLPFDTLPSRPLEFAATLHPINITTSLAFHKLPKPKRQKETAQRNYPSPQYSHSRHVSSKSTKDETDREVVVGSDEWMAAQIARCVDAAKGDLDIA